MTAGRTLLVALAAVALAIATRIVLASTTDVPWAPTVALVMVLVALLGFGRLRHKRGGRR